MSTYSALTIKLGFRGNNHSKKNILSVYPPVGSERGGPQPWYKANQYTAASSATRDSGATWGAILGCEAVWTTYSNAQMGWERERGAVYVKNTLHSLYLCWAAPRQDKITAHHSYLSERWNAGAWGTSIRLQAIRAMGLGDACTLCHENGASHPPSSYGHLQRCAAIYLALELEY